jgi:signal transduction histidine kinase
VSNRRLSRIPALASLALMMAAVFVGDLLIELGVAAGIPYIIPVILSLWVPGRRDTLTVAATATLLTGIGVLLSPAADDIEPWKIILNRLYAILAIWIVAILGMQRKIAEETAARAAKDNLLLFMTAAITAEVDDAEDALLRSVRVICAYLGWPVGHLYRQGDAQPGTNGPRDLLPTGIWHLDDPQEFAAFQRITDQTPIQPGEELPGQVMETGEPVWIHDIRSEPDFLRSRSGEPLGVRGAFGFPIKIGADTVAVLEFFSREPAREDKRTSRLMLAIGTHMSTLLEREQNRHELAQTAMDLTATNHDLEAFTYTVSHDLRSPLHAIEGFSQILQDEHAHELSPEANRYLDRITNSAQQMSILIDQLLEFSRLGRETLTKQHVDIADLVSEIIDEIKPRLQGNNVEFKIGELPASAGDPGLIAEVFINLIDNAIKYSRHSDPALIEVGYQPGQAGGARAAYFVRDNGVGFDMRNVDKLFGVFQRLHDAEEFEGTGVGLAIVERIVSRHGGSIWAQSTPGHGATFSFTFGSRP